MPECANMNKPTKVIHCCLSFQRAGKYMYYKKTEMYSYSNE